MTKLHLLNHFSFERTEPKATRDAFGEALASLAELNSQIVALTADVKESVRLDKFAQAFPDRFFEVGVAEQNLAGVAAGLALAGKIPFMASYAAFSPGRNWDQVRVSICYSQTNVKIIGSHTGLSVGPDGATHQALEDLAITRVLPNLTVVCPVDANETIKAVIAIARHKGPCYLRLNRAKTRQLSSPNSPFEIGKALPLVEGDEAAIFATGSMVDLALQAAGILAPDIRVAVVNVHTLKPLDRQTIIDFAKQTGAVVTAEEHQIIGGLGSAVAEVLAENWPTPLVRVGVKDQFGQSGQVEELLEHYGLTAADIAAAVRQVIKLKAKNAR